MRRVVYNLNLNSRMTRIYSTALTFLVEWTHIQISNLYKRANLNSNYWPYGTPINSNFEADVLESEATAGKKESRLVISISKLTKAARSSNESLA